MIRLIACGAALLGGCSDEDCCQFSDAGVPFVEVAAVPVTPNRDVDILFVVDDSPGGIETQGALMEAFRVFFLNELDKPEGGLPNLHIGVVSTDVGTLGSRDTQPGPPIGTGPGSCADIGKAGVLQNNGGVLVNGNFISDVANSDGTRAVNYTIGITDAFWQIASLGAAGCGFEQPLHAMKRALTDEYSNVGFLRPSANLAVVILADEDDCSFTHSTLLDPNTATFGSMQSFRCTRFGVTCTEGGATTDDMNTPGVKSGCHTNWHSTYVDPVAPYADFLHGLKADRRQVFVAAIAGAPDPIEVELRTPPGGGTARPALAHSCSALTEQGTEVADPAVRIHELTTMFERHYFAGDVCTLDYRDSMTDIARQIRQMLGDPCINRPLPPGTECIALAIRGDTEMPLPGCTGTRTGDCFRLVPDVEHCAAEGHLELEVAWAETPLADTVVSLRCRL